MINMKHISPQMILSCIIGYYLLIKVAGRGLTGLFDISTLREVLYLVATICVGSYLITYVFNQLLKNMPQPKIMYGVSEPIQEDESEQEEEEDDSSDSDYVPPKTRSRRRPEPVAATNPTSDATATPEATSDTTREILDPDTTFPTPL
uniref:Uncharacterized protein n=1 Tax=viral metagenome TaxID=1070528 RepID=A0A6C0APZ6_9ZZZZ